jgi:spermidine synthase
VLHFALTIFLSAFLLFQVQPLIGKIVLPWFGGTPAVWTTCMLFFQVLLLGGYAYAHHSTSRLSPRRQGLLHLGLLAVAVVLTMPTILPGEGWKPDGGDSPLLVILGLLTVTVGLPYFTLSATGSLVQAWFSRTYPQRSPYALYALSNIGSLLGLLTFPFVVEPRLGSVQQASAWFWGYAAFAALCGALALRVCLRAPQVTGEPVREDSSDAPAPSLGLRAVWVGLAACASTMLLAITNQMAIDVASVPFLWVVPLSLYLLSFILCFGSERWYPRVLFYPLLVAAYVGVVGLMLAGAGAKLEVQVTVYSGSLFVFVMVCHGELYRLRPHPRHLTSFYLALSLGGALGGVLVGLVAPYVFPMYYELHLCLLATAALVFYAFRRVPLIAAVAVVLLFALLWSLGRRGKVWLLAPLAVALLAGNLVIEALRRADDAVAITRGFFGMLRVVDRELEDPQEARRILYHGAINHGFQFLHPDKQMWHNSYFAEESGIGVALTRHPARKTGAPLRIGLLGLGAGTLLTYGQPGDHIRIYEIDPEVEPMSREHFTYFARTQASTEVVLGDGRLSLEREPDQAYDVLILDAFSSDAIPMHLLTREAFAVYMRHLKPDGILAANMSNRHVDIKPVLKQFAAALELEFVWISNYDDEVRGVYGADWGLLTRNKAFLAEPLVRASEDVSGVRTDIRMWTDDYTNIFAVLKWLHR